MKMSPQWTAAWAGLAPREKMLAGGAAALVLLALLWWLGIAPALAVLRASDQQHQSVDAQLARMRALQQQAQSLQSQPKQNQDESMRLLEASVRQRLGTGARMAVAGDRVTLTLAGTPPDALATWLSQARVNARAVPVEARLTRGAGGGWDGTLVLSLPPR
ncbi:type II secretion system protein GspM [Ramlibacter sp. Leaf400]|uniref:type II secretion system protein GspM n=1 Tax=Ramlibacter sp. Leaf400 TaxID=1736365 RepID=UPI0006F2FEBC|nr:type II secretion system protein GspM [Ramlibacter sp. Leaf400]KQT14044.1 general secretion pathway protein GspM [Ramlibacter sp. Leaf400]